MERSGFEPARSPDLAARLSNQLNYRPVFWKNAGRFPTPRLDLQNKLNQLTTLNFFDWLWFDFDDFQKHFVRVHIAFCPNRDFVPNVLHPEICRNHHAHPH